MMPPSASDPVSPMKILAGAAFHHRNPIQAPAVAAAISARSSGSRTLGQQPSPGAVAQALRNARR